MCYADRNHKRRCGASASSALTGSRAWIAAAALFIFFFCFTSRLTAQEAAGSFREIGVQQCALCHFSGGNPVLDQFGITQFVALNETQQWLELDRHFLAYQLIDPRGNRESNRLSLRMCETLGIDVATFGEASNTKARDCLTCHAGWTDTEAAPSKHALQFGVRCESCHGNASHWARPENHQQAGWRKIAPQEKLEKYGMRSLNQPAQRADVCYSCHIGNVQENKMVTHAMYAAGHPPLPSIELASHSASMGKHWRTLQEKSADFEHRDAYVQANHPHLKDANGQLRPVEDDLPETRMYLVGGVKAMEHSVRLLHDASQTPSRRWPEYAIYDCASCHHELRISSDRQPVSLPLSEWVPPGRPLNATWPTVSARVAAGFLGSADVAEGGIRSLRAILGEKPFGSREKIADIAGPAGTMPADFRTLAEQLQVRPLQAQDGLQVLRALCEMPDDYRERADYEAARQRAWGIEVVSTELKGKLEFTRDQQAFDAELATMREELFLRLPNDARQPRAAGEPEDRITRERSVRLEAADKFDSARFGEQLARLRGLLLP